MYALVCYALCLESNRQLLPVFWVLVDLMRPLSAVFGGDQRSHTGSLQVLHPFVAEPVAASFPWEFSSLIVASLVLQLSLSPIGVRAWLRASTGLSPLMKTCCFISRLSIDKCMGDLWDELHRQPDKCPLRQLLDGFTTESWFELRPEGRC
jgi:hypothetical protein